MVLVHQLSGENAGTLWAAEFHDDEARIAASLGRFITAPVQSAPAPPHIIDSFRRWFAGDLAALDGLKLARLGSAFEQRVWEELRRIPAGATRSYGEMARLLGDANASRAVGIANSRNPLAIVVPCHRVIGADGSLTGYAGGLHRKDWLLRHEGWAPAQESLF